LTYQWYGEDHIIVGFANGIVALISVSVETMGKEISTISVGPSGPIDAICVNGDIQKMAIAQMGLIKFYSLEDWSEQVGERLEITKSAGKITDLYWTKDGSILSVATGNGYFFGFLTVIPSLCSSYETYAALLSSLTEVSVVDCSKNNMIVAKTNLDVEPTFLDLGSYHFGVGINNSIWYYRWKQPGFDGKMQIV